MKRGLIFTDIHFGKKSNSLQHLQDCLNYIDWICDYVKSHNDIEYIAFLGDWFENRININIFTLDYSYQGAEKINALGIPVFFCVGNHDLAERNSRQIYSTNSMNALNNFIVIDEPMVNKNILGGVMFCPFLMKDEYNSLNDIGNDCEVWMGHFEFKGFILTGGSVRMEHGPDASVFVKPKSILCGHFHKRQNQKNVHYIGNTFPMDFGDNGDNNRGFAIYDHTNHSINYVNWPNCPSYLNTLTSHIIGNTVTIPQNCYLYVDVDTSLKYDEIRALRDKVINDNPSLRSIEFNENSTKIKEIQQINDVGEELLEQDEHVSTNSSLNDIILRLLETTNIPNYENDVLTTIYRDLK